MTSTTRDTRAGWLLFSAQGWAATYKPDVVLMHIGSNDMIQNSSLTGTRVELGEIIDASRMGHPTVKILLAQLLPTSLSPGNENITALNALLPELAQQKSTPQSPVTIVDHNTGVNPVTETYDGIHLNEVGEERMAARWYTALQALLDTPVSTFYPLATAASGAGTVSRSPDQATYAAGTVATLTATPGSGQQFVGWSGDATGSANPLAVAMTAAKTITATFAPLPPPPPPPAVTSYTLVNADTDLDIQPLATDATLNLATLPTRNLNIRATTTPAAVGSVRFSLTGADTRDQTESQAPYALFSDAGGDYNAWTPAVGSYSLTAIAYSEAGGGGAAGSPLTLTFTVVNTATQATVTSFTLVNADTDQDIQDITSGAMLDLAALPTQNLNIRVNTSPAVVGSVAVVLTGTQEQVRTESMAPYALFSDANGNYNGWIPTTGSYTITATPYAEAGAVGDAGKALTVSFNVLGQPLPNTQAQATRQLRVAASGAARAYPNPSYDGRFVVALPAAEAGTITYTLVSALGSMVASGAQPVDAQAGELVLDWSGQMLAPGVYYLSLKSPALTTRLKLLRF
ncbi:InlB B-repeat-containing protein [Hymenobacter elongatus]|uniref:Uncharacterized protein n=1 Tax=Hymenobacter elongatus TaxID=877208 RepID=A0A4Z0PH28_9BACT|nr:GDSL-type esterase/lipase family protein [Hymenobacter elongatus]TGE14053.1 hypothetical protein E5J99_17885 [Hymenobacter elongatus]